MEQVTLVVADGTLIADVPYNGDPDRVVSMPGARAALDRLRAAGLRLGVVTNQSGVARGRFTTAQLDAVNRRVEVEATATLVDELQDRPTSLPTTANSSNDAKRP